MASALKAAPNWRLCTMEEHSQRWAFWLQRLSKCCQHHTHAGMWVGTHLFWLIRVWMQIEANGCRHSEASLCSWFQDAAGLAHHVHVVFLVPRCACSTFLIQKCNERLWKELLCCLMRTSVDSFNGAKVSDCIAWVSCNIDSGCTVLASSSTRHSNTMKEFAPRTKKMRSEHGTIFCDPAEQPSNQYQIVPLADAGR